jgi:hypothetical protein
MKALGFSFLLAGSTAAAVLTASFSWLAWHTAGQMQDETKAKLNM